MDKRATTRRGMDDDGNSSSLILDSEGIKRRIYTTRDAQVMLDEDLAELYDVETKALNQAVKRNSERFPKDFMFQLSKEEFENLKSQTVTSSWGGRRTSPYAFTEQGVAMLSGVLKSNTAVRISIQIMSAFVAMRKFISSNAQIFHRLDVVEKKQIEHDKNSIRYLMLYRAKASSLKKVYFLTGRYLTRINLFQT